jgi:hypothetical protein
MAAGVLRTKSIEVAPVTSLLGKAKPAAGDARWARPAAPADAEPLAALVARATRSSPLARVVAPESIRAELDSRPPRRTLVLVREGSDEPAGVCTYARRSLVGREITEVASALDAERFGRAIAADAFEAGASFVIAPQREDTLFPHVRAAGLRLSPRTLRVFVVPSHPGSTLGPRSAHLLEVE